MSKRKKSRRKELTADEYKQYAYDDFAKRRETIAQVVNAIGVFKAKGYTNEHVFAALFTESMNLITNYEARKMCFVALVLLHDERIKSQVSTTA